MQVIRGLHNLRSEHRCCVATIGNFDGAHLGHQAVFRHLLEEGAEKGLPSTVITFEPHPLEFFQPVAAPARLTRLREKLQVLEDAGIQRVMLLEFGAKLASMSAVDFVRQVMVDGLGIHYLLVGDDFRFGQGRAGDIELLREAGSEYGYDVDSMDTIQVNDERISSTRIRKALAQGDLAQAERCLGRAYRICGRVVYGDQRGRSIGFPTANIGLHRKASPLHGVFAVMAHGLGDNPLPGVANIGNQPTVDGDRRYLLEVHLLDFDQDIYGRHLEVEFCKRLRSEKKFDSLEALSRQIERDARGARKILNLK
ncbi:FMN adenylyltransferase / Riboflavin kinase [hydrothermal vent metagenome]|uniref:Bifunctional riboflavin kinase/FMN adenylyltransferase n=1 Tax=hydrothermal vent metagenome TaxID=652676 RepID=A0A3B1B1X7_9ZZZZ